MDTLRHALIEEIMLVTLAHVIFLTHFRSILDGDVAAAAGRALLIPPDALLHVTSNIMSLAGIAIAIGVLVDAGIVVTENAFRHWTGSRSTRPTDVSSTRSCRRQSWWAVPSSSRWQSSSLPSCRCSR